MNETQTKADGSGTDPEQNTDTEAITDILREEDDFGWGTVRTETPGGGVSEGRGWVTTGFFEDTDTGAVVILTTATPGPDGELSEQHLIPLSRVLEVEYDAEKFEQAVLGE